MCLFKCISILTCFLSPWSIYTGKNSLRVGEQKITEGVLLLGGGGGGVVDSHIS